MRIYLDVCCLNRPFDDQTQDRIHLEAEAILSIIKFVEKGQWTLLNSDGILYEVSKIPDPERRKKVQIIISRASEHIRLEKKILARAKRLKNLGIKSLDALHVACAESGKVDIFLTTDDRLLRILHQYSDEINVKADNPLAWIKEVI
ncbi:MAG: PIN domain-containing protein [Deltaproteobacteria bacterium]|nr:PIN domain-containing protein [Deltaproteobacteria bacterium]MBW1929699.1 PIN domain-containing protein [Deltaproteobacteria bacterium]MBW2023989.1 PIN domain-containing protein [Deltaproteobacteria bacterium]MBW2125007.1 PIN domain-containing protein [Deltaproteobacteria bacterium]RLB17337.1 MAG: PIN domain-containing protein [Deltaproteobacteria bacterium]